jgi:cation:H+ antiporter
VPTWLVFVLSGIAVAAAGMQLARDGEAIAARTGLGGLWVGAILVAAATSLPELTTNLFAVWQGHAPLAVGDLFGSNLANLAILAAADLAVRRTRILTRVAINQALVGVLGICLTAIALVGVLSSSFTLAGLAWPTLVIAFTYGAGMRLLHRNRPAPPFRTPEDVAAARRRAAPLRRTIIQFTLSALVIVVAAPWLASSGAALATQLGLSSGFVGLLFVAFATSLPELAVSVESIRNRAYDLAVGNLLGSNCFNMAALVVLDAADGQGSLLAHGGGTALVGAVFGILMTALALLDILNKSEKRIWVLEPGPAFMLLAYGVGVYLAYRAGP